MTIHDLLKNDGNHSHARVTCGNRWLCWYDEQWTVFDRPYRAQRTRIVIQTKNEAEAVAELIK